MVKYIILFIFLFLVISSSILFDYWDFIINLITQYHTEVLDFIENKFVLSLILFTLIYVISIAISLPIGSLLTFIGGYIFGAYYGFFSVIIGATVGALILFVIIKAGILRTIGSIHQKSELINKIKFGIDKNIWSYLFFIRFFPIFPFWFVNIAPAILGVRLLPYTVTTFFGIMPGSLSIILIGTGVEDIVNKKGDFIWNFSDQKFLLFGLLLLSLISTLPIFFKKFNLLKL
tara:strand:+ start:2408 stop:3103 length:696 start_codon:yes stop_codon:yes gene_type:complete